MFEHADFDRYEYSEIPLNRDIYLVDEAYLHEYHQMMLEFLNNRAEYRHIGYVSPVAARHIGEHSVELTWYITHERWHEIRLTLPKSEIICCVGSWQCDEKPRIFVKSGWLDSIHLRYYSVFAMIDAIGVKNAISTGALNKEKLLQLRSRIDELAEKYPTVSFVSFADSLLLKSNWTVGHHKKGVPYTYSPEIFLNLFNELQLVYSAVLGLKIYGVFVQGANEYYEDETLHISNNHVCLNSLGIPFADLMTIDQTVGGCIKSGNHPPCDLYMDEGFYHSLRFKYGFDKHAMGQHEYQAKMRTQNGLYYFSSYDEIVKNLKDK